VIQRKVLNELSKQILADKITKDSVVSVELSPDQEIEFVNVEAPADSTKSDDYLGK